MIVTDRTSIVAEKETGAYAEVRKRRTAERNGEYEEPDHVIYDQRLRFLLSLK